MATSKPVDEEELPNFSLGLEFLNPQKGAQYLDIRRLTHELIVKCHETLLSNFKQWELPPNWANSIYKTRHGWTNLKKIFLKTC